MAKRIATQLKDEIKEVVEAADAESFSTVVLRIPDLRRWFDWATKLDARMRLDGSPRNKRKPAK